jgi:hypothetical protein
MYAALGRIPLVGKAGTGTTVVVSRVMSVDAIVLPGSRWTGQDGC